MLGHLVFFKNLDTHAINNPPAPSILNDPFCTVFTSPCNIGHVSNRSIKHINTGKVFCLESISKHSNRLSVNPQQLLCQGCFIEAPYVSEPKSTIILGPKQIIMFAPMNFSFVICSSPPKATHRLLYSITNFSRIKKQLKT